LGPKGISGADDAPQAKELSINEAKTAKHNPIFKKLEFSTNR